MSLLNSKIPIINTYDINNPSITYSRDHPVGISELLSNPDYNFDFWYCLFSCEKSFKIYDLTQLIDADSLNKIKNKQAFLVLDNSLEPFELVIDSIYENVVSKGIPAEQIILLTNLYDAKTYCKKISEQFNQPMLRIFWYTVFEQDLKKDLVNNVYTIYNNDNKLPQTLEIKKYHKKFLNFNRRWRLHRPFLVALLHSRNLLEQGYVSLGPCEAKDNWDYRWNELIRYFRNDQSMLDLLKSCEDVKELPPLFLDTEELHINRAVSTVDTNQFYENSYFSVVSETTFFTKYNYSFRFLSEKAFKPIAMKHPFILVSVPHSLEIFKIMGYKTFSSVIDESYDLELDDGKRMLMILNEIERLSKFNKHERANFILQCRGICQYNYDMLLSKTKFITEL